MLKEFLIYLSMVLTAILAYTLPLVPMLTPNQHGIYLSIAGVDAICMGVAFLFIRRE